MSLCDLIFAGGARILADGENSMMATLRPVTVAIATLAALLTLPIEKTNAQTQAQRGKYLVSMQERVNLAALFAGQMEIAFGHFSSVRCAVPRKDSLPSDRQKNRHTQHGKVWREKTSASRVLAALASSPATKALDPDPFPRHSLRHAVYAALLHFGFETADPISPPMIKPDLANGPRSKSRRRSRRASGRTVALWRLRCRSNHLRTSLTMMH